MSERPCGDAHALRSTAAADSDQDRCPAARSVPDTVCALQSAQIAWRCRRGLLELDLWLGGFWAAQRATLRSRETAAFVRLLALSDMEIMDRLQCRSSVDDPDLAALIQRLQNFREVK